MRTVRLYGELGKRFGKEHRLAVRTAREAIQALSVNFAGFKEMFRTCHTYGIGFKVIVGRSPLNNERDTDLPSSAIEDICIVPAIFGSSGFVKILVGAVLIAGGVIVNLIPGAQAIGSAMIKIGAAVALSGLYQLLTEPPAATAGGNTDVNDQSFIFSGPENVTRQGGGVPVGYGRMMIGSTVISAGIEDTDQ